MQTAWRKSKDEIQLIVLGVDVIAAVCLYLGISQGVCDPPIGPHRLLPMVDTKSPKGQPPSDPISAATGGRRLSPRRLEEENERGGRSITGARRMLSRMHAPRNRHMPAMETIASQRRRLDSSIEATNAHTEMLCRCLFDAG